MMKIIGKGIFILTLIWFLNSCTSPQYKKEKALFTTHCASCHIAPEINSLPKKVWDTAILPEMAARMGIKEKGYKPYQDLSFDQQLQIMKTGVFPASPTIAVEDWKLLRSYITSLAPDSLVPLVSSKPIETLTQFSAKPVILDSIPDSFITYLEYEPATSAVLFGNIAGYLSAYHTENDTVINRGNFGSPIVGYAQRDNLQYITSVGYLDPSEIPSGRIFMLEGKEGELLPEVFHRPVHTLVKDLNNDGIEEIVISEFGNYTGKLSLLVRNKELKYDRHILMATPGSTRVIARDMNKDDTLDLVVLSSQGDESITIWYQENELNFKPKKVIQFSPIYGSSWFELLDYDGDGDDDIITVHGDNADKSYVHKPYHGLRLHLNDGNNNFKEAFFYPMYGATRCVANDFDKDGDIDFGVLSTFPDYERRPEYAFVYLENQDSKQFAFKEGTFKEVNSGRWLLLDSGDVDKDGDDDIILSSFTYSFTPVPNDLKLHWKEKSYDLMILENQLKSP